MALIDKETIRAEIERRINHIKENLKSYWDAPSYIDALNGLNDFLDTLQQDQPDCHTVEDWMQHIKNADQFTKDVFSKGPYDVLYDALNHPYQHCYDAIKEFGGVCFQTGVNSVKQEQPVDGLEEEIQRYFDGWGEIGDGDSIVTKNCDYIGLKDLPKIARHFYELGLNSKK